MSVISKKELLKLTGISYGQLYRWKREQLIPEDWFIKRSSYTGQETVFPKEQIIDRIEFIMSLKDDYSLEEISRMLSGNLVGKISKKQLALISEIDDRIRKFVLADEAVLNEYTIVQVAYFVFISEAMRATQGTDEQLEALIHNSLPIIIAQESVELLCTIFESAGDYHMMLAKDAFSQFDSSISVVYKGTVNETAKQLKIKYQDILNKIEEEL